MVHEDRSHRDAGHARTRPGDQRQNVVNTSGDNQISARDRADLERLHRLQRAIGRVWNLVWTTLLTALLLNLDGVIPWLQHLLAFVGKLTAIWKNSG